MKRRSFLILSTIAALSVAVGCGRSQPRATSELRVGVILPLTGALAEMGFYERAAMEIGERDSGGKSLRLIFEDSRSTAAGATTAANKLVSADRVQLLVTSTTGASLAVQPIAEGADVPLVAFCMDPTITDQHPSTVRFYIGIDEETQQLVQFLTGLARTERVAILHAAVPVWRKAVQSGYLPALSNRFDVAPLVEEYSLQDRDYRAILGKIDRYGTTVLVLLGYGFEYPQIYQQLEELRIRQRLRQIVGGWGFLYSSLKNDQLEGTIVAGPEYVFRRTKAGDDFARRFEESTRRKANFDAAFAYELVTTVPLLHARNQVSVSSLKSALRGLGTRSGVVGEYVFSERGDMIVRTALGQYRAGVLTPHGR